jgi:mRNA interferase RelE/StbE
MQKKTRSLLEELDAMYVERDRRHVIETRASNLIESAIRLLEQIDTEFTPEQAEKIKDISNIKKISGYSNYYRVKSGNYRIGIELFHENTIRFIIISHRKDIYNKFPK